MADLSKDYLEAGETSKRELEAAKNTASASYEKLRNESGQTYDDINKNALINSRLNVSPAGEGGVTETSRLAEVTNLENSYNYNNAARTAEQEEIARAALNMGLTNDADIANMWADNISAKMQANASQNKFDYELAAQEEDEEYQKALQSWDKFGYVMSKKQADILGVPVGTKKYTASGRRSSSGGGSSSAGMPALSDAAKSVLTGDVDLLAMYYAGMKAGSGTKGSTTGNTYFAGYENALNNSNKGLLGDEKVKNYLKSKGVTDEREQEIIMGAYKIPEYKD